MSASLSRSAFARSNVTFCAISASPLQDFSARRLRLPDIFERSRLGFESSFLRAGSVKFE